MPFQRRSLRLCRHRSGSPATQSSRGFLRAWQRIQRNLHGCCTCGSKATESARNQRTRMPEAITTSATNAAPVRPGAHPGSNGQANLSGRRRAAILLMALGEDVARELLHDLPDPMIELVAAEIASLDH